MASASATPRQTASQAGLARLLGVSRQAIHDLVKRKIISPDADGQFDVELVRVAIARRVRPSGKTASAVSAPQAMPADLPPPASDVPPATDDQVSYHVARTLREAEEARIARIKRQQLEHSLIEAEPAIQATFTAFRQLRDSCMPIGRRVAAKVAAMTDAREIQLLIDEEVRAALRLFADRTLANLATSLSGAPVSLPADLATNTSATPEKAP